MPAQLDASMAVAHLIPRLARFATNRLEQGDQPLSISQFYVLQRIAEGISRGIDLARRSNVSPATMSGLVDRLVGAGLVRREPHPDDRRSYAVSLTEAGRAVLASGERRLVDGVEMLMRFVPAEERASIARTFALIEAALDARIAQVTA